MASLILLKGLFGKQYPIYEKTHENTLWNLKNGIRWVSSRDSCTAVIIAKGNIIEGIEAKE